MYTEEYEAKSFPLRKFLLRFIFVVTFISLLIWLVPKFTSPKLENTNKEDLSPIKNQIFASNLQKMQEVGIDYYTRQRLPQEVGKSSRLTLSDMIEKKLIVPLVDQDNKACNIKKSYVRVTKLEQEYLMKVNLKCSKEEDYILVHLGDFNYCDSYVCPKKEVEVEEEKSKPKETVSFGRGGSSKPAGGSSNSSKTDGDLPIEETKVEEPTPTLPTQVVGHQYEYKKVEGATYSNWSNWSNWQRTDCNTSAYGCSDDNPSCLKKVQIYKRKEQVGTYNKEYVASRQELRHTTSFDQQVCANYDYISFGGQFYVATAPYSTIQYVTAATKGNVNGWKYEGRKSFASPPSDSLITHYKYVGADFSGCGGTCQVAPKKIYDVYTYTGVLGMVSSATSSQNITTVNNQKLNVNCVGTTRKTVPIYASVTTYEKAVRREALYGTVCYASTKTRSVLNPGKSDTRWSGYNDMNLLNNGYYYTGNSRK